MSGQKPIDDNATTDVDDTQVSIEGFYIGPPSAHARYSPFELVTNDPRRRKDARESAR